MGICFELLLKQYGIDISVSQTIGTLNIFRDGDLVSEVSFSMESESINRRDAGSLRNMAKTTLKYI